MENDDDIKDRSLDDDCKEKKRFKEIVLLLTIRYFG